MDTNKLKKFATEARNRLKAGIAAKIITLGFDKNGRVPDHMHPQLMQGGSLWNGRLETEGFYHQWQALYSRVQQKGIKEVYEEAAYTWFNRLVAIRILQKNSLIEPVLSYVDEARTPRIVDEARMGRMPQMQERQRQLLTELLDDDSKTTEQFAILVTAFCHENPILSRCFGAMSDYTELLLPNDILTEGGFIDMLNHTEFITDDDFRSPELIGWLYQFYISERKDEVFAKKGKFEADEIPAATQIFTPNWIVKYMVQNTIGRIYLDNNPSAAAEFIPKWKYLVHPELENPGISSSRISELSNSSQDKFSNSQIRDKQNILELKNLEDYLVGDLACGSGHILNECFDLFYDLYIYEGYSRREAIENIFKCNLRGVDLDTRAKQLATFALMLKACQKDASFADAHILPHVLSMPTPIPQEQVADRLQQFFRETPSRQQLKDLTAAFELMQDAESLGSIMKFDVAESTLLSIRQTLNYWQHEQFVPEEVEDILPAMELILTLTDKYAALVMNPPYMGSGNMNETLSNYVKRNYEEGKADLFSTFMLLAIDRLADKGKYGMINMHSWMFLSSFEKLRRSLLENEHIDSLLHLGPRTFDELSGEVVQNAAFVISKTSEVESPQGANSESAGSELGVRKERTNSGTYFRLVDGKNCGDKERMFLDAQANHTAKVYYPNVWQCDLEKIPGFSIGYWVNVNLIRKFAETPNMESFYDVKSGLSTGNNDIFIRHWYEVNGCRLFLLYSSEKEDRKNYKWIPYSKGGGTQKWYGNNLLVVNWENEAQAMRDYGLAVFRNEPYYFIKGITWSGMSSRFVSYRYIYDGFVFDSNKGPMIFGKENGPSILYAIGFLNTHVSNVITQILNPTLSTQIGDIIRIPLDFNEDIKEKVEDASRINIEVSKADWDSHETSWDFEANPLVALRNEKVSRIIELENSGKEKFDNSQIRDKKEVDNSVIRDRGEIPTSFRLQDLVEEFEAQWTERFMQLHHNEEELNRQFISIYGLEDELTPDVPLDEITILQQGEISIIDN